MSDGMRTRPSTGSGRTELTSMDRMGTMGHPVTRTELREELRQLNLLTKADLAEFETRMVKWITITMLGGMAVSAAIASVVTNLLG